MVKQSCDKGHAFISDQKWLDRLCVACVSYLEIMETIALPNAGRSMDIIATIALFLHSSEFYLME